MKNKTILILCLLLICLCILLPGINIIEQVVLERSRAEKVEEIKLASQEPSDNWIVLIKALDSTNWYVVAVATQAISEVKHQGKVNAEMENEAMNSIFSTLIRKGPWWRFGWDRETAEFQQFQAVGISTVADFGISALPTLDKALRGENYRSQEIVCWILSDMLRKGLLDRNILVVNGVYEQINTIVSNTRNIEVDAACAPIVR